jgi:RNA polymerase sigma-70 factor (sigma-E family)
MGPDEALGELMTVSGDRLLRLAHQLTHDRSLAEDVVQEALVSIYRTWRRSAPDVANGEAYAKRVVVNEFLRRRRLKSAREVVTDLVPDRAVAAEDTVVVDRDELWRALGTLPARQRTVLVLRYYEDLPDGRIAELIEAKEATVRSLAARGLASLRGSAVALEGDRP